MGIPYRNLIEPMVNAGSETTILLLYEEEASGGAKHGSANKLLLECLGYIILHCPGLGEGQGIYT